MTEQQANLDSVESQLVFELWELIAPTKVNKSDLMHKAEAAALENRKEEEKKNEELDEDEEVEA